MADDRCLDQFPISLDEVAHLLPIDIFQKDDDEYDPPNISIFYDQNHSSSTTEPNPSRLLVPAPYAKEPKRTWIRTIYDSSYQMTWNNLFTTPTWGKLLATSEARIKRGTGAFIPKYDHYQTDPLLTYGARNRKSPFRGKIGPLAQARSIGDPGIQVRAKGTGVFHAHLDRNNVLIAKTTADTTPSVARCTRGRNGQEVRG